MSEPLASAACSLFDLPFEVLERIWVTLDPQHASKYTADRHSLRATCSAARRFSPLIQHVQLQLTAIPHPSAHQYAGHMAAWAAAPAAQQRFLQSIGMLRSLDIKPEHVPDMYVGSEPQPWLAALHHFLALARPQLHGVATINFTRLSTLDAKDMCQLLGAAPSLTALSLDGCRIDVSALASLGLASQLRSLTITEPEWPERLDDEGNPEDVDARISDIAASLRSASVLTSLTRLDLDLCLESWSLHPMLPTLARLSHLRQLSLTHNIGPNGGPEALDLVSFSDLQPLRQLTDLRFCTDDVVEFQIDAADVRGLAGLTQLCHLSLIGLEPSDESLGALLGLPRLRSLHLTSPRDGSNWRNTAAAVPADAEDTGDRVSGSVRELRCGYIYYGWLALVDLLGLTRIEYEDMDLLWHLARDSSVAELERAARSLAHCMRLSGAAAAKLLIDFHARGGQVPSARQADTVAALAVLDTLMRSLSLSGFSVDGALAMQLARSLPQLPALALLNYTVADAEAMPALLQLRHLTSLSLFPKVQDLPREGPPCRQLLSHFSAVCEAAERPLQLLVHGLTEQQLEECKALAAALGGKAQHVTIVRNAPAVG